MESEPMNLDAPLPKLPRTMNQRLLDAANQPKIEPLLGAFWSVGELHVLYADTGTGKSTLATQIADALSKGIETLGLQAPSRKRCVLTLDFELSDRQVEVRYQDPITGIVHEFSDLFQCDGLDFVQLSVDYPKMSLDEAILHCIRDYIMRTGAEVLIIDNITYLSMQSAQETQVALELMKRLVALKNELGISILVLAHTPKIYGSRPLTINDLAGSKQIANFADSVSGMGRSCEGADVVYWKQCKASRSGEFVYDADNVLVLRRTHITPSFLGFEVIDTDSEFKHLRVAEPDDRIRIREQACEMYARGAGTTEIARKLLGDAKKKTTISHWVKHVKRIATTNDDQTDLFKVKDVDTRSDLDESNALNLLNDLNPLNALNPLKESGAASMDATTEPANPETTPNSSVSNA